MRLEQTTRSTALLAATGRMPGEALWRAVAARDSSCDGKFVYAVRSTGIYCRPSCPARRPRREQVVFFRLPEAAEQQGFRACRRCRPQAAELRDPGIERVARVCREIDARILADGSADADSEARLTLAMLGASAGMSPHQLERAFRKSMGITPRQYAEAQRLRRVKARLKKGDNVTTALYDAGYGSASRLYERVPSHLGMTPGAYRRGGAGMRIEYTITGSPLGRMLVGATHRGVSAVYLGGSDAALRSALRNEYPRAELVAAAKGGDSRRGGNFAAWVEEIVGRLRGQEPHLDLPTDVQATAFQQRVWKELRSIPYGATRTYTEVARAIGRPTAVRAVARACATNPVSVVVPCHRVVREDGSLAGYRWGIGRKRALLARESSGSKPKGNKG
ncbi:MAG: bifunctional DNA-binding transcriptional regulator/O6-methylguanine-DNA methyltransferase Ada [Acidobacteriia bacterium]|nr:bifunctional DNA-binding transcriptional regulator/O6-methylguanine-DNA methyltransferase Ada [Terriglobia bacterium]